MPPSTVPQGLEDDELDAIRFASDCDAYNAGLRADAAIEAVAVELSRMERSGAANSNASTIPPRRVRRGSDRT